MIDHTDFVFIFRPMPTAHFLGRVLPTIVQVSVDRDPTIKWEAPDLGLVMEFKTHVEKSCIDVECTLNRYDASDFVHLYMRAFDVARASVNLVAFSQGWGLTIVLETFIDPAGNSTHIVPKDDSLPALCTSGFDELNTLVLSDWRLGLALNDLIQAITLPHVSVVNCARAIEGLKHLIAAAGANDNQAWSQMRQALNLDRPYLQLITATSTNSRHGKHVHVPGTVTTEITRRSWCIMSRYFEYRKRGGKNLSEPDFPLLVG
jgi:hypothetical protein